MIMKYLMMIKTPPSIFMIVSNYCVLTVDLVTWAGKNLPGSTGGGVVGRGIIKCVGVGGYFGLQHCATLYWWRLLLIFI